MDGVCRHQTAVLTIKFSFSETMRMSHHVSALGELEQPRPRSPAPGAGSAAASRSPVPRWSSPRDQGDRVWGENGPASRGLSRSPPWGRPAGAPAAGSRLTVTPGLPAQQPGAPPPPRALSGGRGAPRPAPHRLRAEGLAPSVGFFPPALERFRCSRVVKH